MMATNPYELNNTSVGPTFESLWNHDDLLVRNEFRVLSDGRLNAYFESRWQDVVRIDEALFEKFGYRKGFWNLQ